MARLIIGNEVIRFDDEGTNFTGQIARLIADGDVIFIVKYNHTDFSNQEVLRLKRNFCETARKFFWVNYYADSHNDLVQIVGQEIEKHPHLLSPSV